MKTSHAPKPGSPCEKARRIAGDILLVLTIAFTVYLSIIMLRRIQTVVLSQVYRTIFRNELALCGVFLLFAADLRWNLFTRLGPLPLKILGWTVRAALLLAVLGLLAIGGRIVFSGVGGSAGPAEHAVVLGMALEDGQPTRDLRFRLETAAAYAERNPQTVLILTGGNPDEQGRTEAAVMRDLLADMGIPEERLRLEDRATDTRENFLNAAQMLDPSAPTVLISSNYHMCRALRLARSAGFSKVIPLPAPSDPLRYGANFMWEVILELNHFLTRS